MIIGLFKGLFRLVFGLVFVAIIVGLGGYYYHLRNQLQRTAERDLGRPHDIKIRPIPAAEWLPVTIWGLVKIRDDHNWIPTKSFGMVSAVYWWSVDRNAWQRAEMPVDQDEVTRLKRLTSEEIQRLIQVLSDPDPHAREVAIVELKKRTGEDLGYRYDASEVERQAAVARWQEWWKRNWTRYTANRIFDVIDRVRDAVEK